MLSSLLRPVAGGWISHAKLASVKCIHPQKVCGVRQHMLPVCSLQWEYMQRRMNLVCGFVSGLIGGQEFPCCNCIGKLLLMCMQEFSMARNVVLCNAGVQEFSCNKCFK